MRLTIHHSLTGHGDLDLDVSRGTPLHEVVAAFHAPTVWCGDVALDQELEAGEWPLFAGAVLSARRRPAIVAPGALHLAAIAGPDAGILIPISSATVIGTAPGRGTPPGRGTAPGIGTAPFTDYVPPTAVVRDDAIDARHATVSPTRAGSLRIKDNGSVNGTGVWSRRGGAFSWRGRRRTSTVDAGDVIAIGRTLLEVRRGLAPPPAIAGGADFTASRAPTGATEASGTYLVELSRAMLRRGRFFGLVDHVRGRRASHFDEFPDPTRTHGWSGPIAIGGAHAVELARAVILARGRRPPHPGPIDEPWLAWLPPALASDGRIRIGANSTTSSASGWTILTAEADRTTSRIGAVTNNGPVVRVCADTADALARSRAGSSPDLPPRTIHWADAAALVSRPVADGERLDIVTGVRVDNPAIPWTIALGPASLHTVIAGAPGSGKTTLMATIAGALAVRLPPRELALVILCAGVPGALEPYMDLPHVTAAASKVRPGAALRIVNSLDTDAALTVVIADDIDALGPDGRAVTARLEAIAMRGGPGHVHVVIATRRPTAVITPTLRAATGTAIALRTACIADSVEVTGIDAAASIPIDAQGMAFVRSAGRVDKVHVALPFADGLPRVRRCDGPIAEPTTLASAARAATSATPRERPAPADRARPAS